MPIHVMNTEMLVIEERILLRYNSIATQYGFASSAFMVERRITL